MNVNIRDLINKDVVEINDKVNFSDLNNSQIKRLNNVFAKGYVKYNALEQIEVILDVKGTMFIEDAISLKEVPYDFSFKIDDTIDMNNAECANYFKNNQNILDISEILWENIVLEVPISYTKEQNVSLSGKGWEFNNVQDNFKGGE